MNFSLDRVAVKVGQSIDDELSKIGILYRLFSRAKDSESIRKKQLRKSYSIGAGQKKMQDIIGVRVTLYFADDIEIVRELIKRKFSFVDETIDKAEATQFKPTRINLIFRLDENHSRELYDSVCNEFPFSDNTFEVQLRTVLSEGWHEVDHDLRYKCENDWNKQDDLLRAFNGIFAGLETSDWSILMIFDKLSYRHYKNSNWKAMIRTKFRLRIRDDNMDEKLLEVLNSDKQIGKAIFLIVRDKFLQEIVKRDIRIPFTFHNIIFLLNCFYFGNQQIYELTPEPMLFDKAINQLVS
jgi:putative GTP pyrophosphokinase